MDVTTRDLVAALTFDDGPNPDATPLVLDLLDRYRARATFFMVGKAAREYPDLVRSVVQRGHVIGNHSFNHAPFPSLSLRRLRQEIADTDRTLGGLSSRLIRPPGGFLNATSRLALMGMGRKVILWNATSLDWHEEESDRMLESLNRDMKPGAILLFHDGIFSLKPSRNPPSPSRSSMLTTLGKFLDQWAATYSFVTIPELLKHGRERRVWRSRSPRGQP